MTRKNLAVLQLCVLTGIHFTADMLSGTLPGYLPQLMSRYSFGLTFASFLVMLCALASNALQIPAGNLRKNSVRPALIQLGLLLGAATVLTAVIPPGAYDKYALVAMVLLIGIGVSLVHPEGLRAVCAIDAQSISPAVATSVFMLSGFCGYAAGPLIGGTLVEFFGFKGLFALLLLVLPLIFLVHHLKLRLAREQTSGASKRPARAPDYVPEKVPLSFRALFLIATFINTGCGIIQSFLPTYLETLGYEAFYRGFSSMLFGLGAGFGAILTGKYLIRRIPVIRCIQLQILGGVPIMALYILFAGVSPWMMLLALAGGALVGSGFPQLVTLARTAPNGPGLGARMGLIVGGTWGFAGLILQGVGFLADHTSIQLAMLVSPLFSLCVPVVSQILKWSSRKKSCSAQ